MNADGANNDAARIWRLDAQTPNKDRGWGPVIYNNSNSRQVIIDGVTYSGTGGASPSVAIMGFWVGVGGVTSGQTHQWVQIGIITTFNSHIEHIGKIVRRFRSENMSSGSNGENWVIVG